MEARRRIATTAAALVLSAMGALAGGCGSSSTGGVAPGVTPEVDRPAAIAVTVPRLTGSGGLTVGTPDRRPTVVNLWASWCGPCKAEMPLVQQFASGHPGIRVVGIAINNAPGPAREFAQEVGVTFPLGIDEDDAVGDGYGVVGLPTTLVLDRAGRLAAIWVGPVTADGLDRLTAPLADGS